MVLCLSWHRLVMQPAAGGCGCGWPLELINTIAPIIATSRITLAIRKMASVGPHTPLLMRRSKPPCAASKGSWPACTRDRLAGSSNFRRQLCSLPPPRRTDACRWPAPLLVPQLCGRARADAGARLLRRADASQRRGARRVGACAHPSGLQVRTLPSPVGARRLCLPQSDAANELLLLLLVQIQGVRRFLWTGHCCPGVICF